MRPGLGRRDSGFGAQAPATVRTCALRSAKSRIPNPQSRQQGFTLLEVIAAIMLLGIAFAALLKVAGGAMALSRNAAAHDEAALWARSALDSAYVTEAVTPGSRSGKFNARYRWTLTTTAWQPPGSQPGENALGLYRLDLAVRWGSAAHPQVAHFETLRLGPAQADTP